MRWAQNKDNVDTHPSDSADVMFGADRKTYGPSYQEHLLQQYVLYVQTAEGPHLVLRSKWAQASIYLLGVVLCITWWRTMLAYKRLNSAKFKVIG